VLPFVSRHEAEIIGVAHFGPFRVPLFNVAEKGGRPIWRSGEATVKGRTFPRQTTRPALAKTIHRVPLLACDLKSRRAEDGRIALGASADVRAHAVTVMEAAVSFFAKANHFGAEATARFG
jgi:hypothetical protein